MYYIYVGYYELHLCKHRLEDPFVYWGKYNSFDEMYKEAKRLDKNADLIYYDDIATEAMSYLSINDKSQLNIA